jgi:hypothetical protein
VYIRTGRSYIEEELKMRVPLGFTADELIAAHRSGEIKNWHKITFNEEILVGVDGRDYVGVYWAEVEEEELI